jgi:hypothetical protein
MKSQPTPGAWRQVVTSVYAGNLLLAVTPTRSASCPEAAQYDVDVANARLMAAAPDLLAALRELVAKYDAQGHDSPELGKARAAIDKAEGQL